MSLPAPVKIKGLHHVALSVPDLDKAIHFYQTAFGFELVRS
jgi:catechol 2,3-dioxygenase-like lactoylglutathione lyase family enzyme